MKYKNIGGFIIGHLQYAVPEDSTSNVRDIDAFMDKLGEILSGYLPAGDDWLNAIDSAIDLSLPKEFTPQQLAQHDALATYLYDYDGRFESVVERLLAGSDVGVEPHTAYRETKPDTLGKLIMSMYGLLESRYTQLMDSNLGEGINQGKKTRQRRKEIALRPIPNDEQPSFAVGLPFEGQNSDAKGS